MLWSFSWSIFIPVLLSSLTKAFNNSFNGFTQCGIVDLEWWGAAYPPFSFSVVPVDSDKPFKITIPDNYDTWNATSGRGIYRLPPIPLPVGTPFLVSMNDNKGYGTGGVSTIHTIGESTNVSCLPVPPAEPNPKIIVPAPPRQCEVSLVTWNASSPLLSDQVRILGWIPGVSTFGLYPPPPGSNATWWTVDFLAGTQFVMVISTGGPWGLDTPLSTTSLLTVQGNELSDATCLKGGSPSSTATQPSATPSTSSAAGQQESKKSPSTSVIAGSVVGGIIALLLLASLIFWLYRRKKASEAKIGPLITPEAWSEPLVVHTTISPSTYSEGQQKSREGTGGYAAVSGAVASGDPSPVAAQMVSLNHPPSTGYSHYHHPGYSSGGGADLLPFSAQPGPLQSPHSLQEGGIRHRDGGPVPAEFPPLYEDAYRPGRVGSVVPFTRPVQGGGTGNK